MGAGELPRVIHMQQPNTRFPNDAMCSYTEHRVEWAAILFYYTNKWSVRGVAGTDRQGGRPWL